MAASLPESDPFHAFNKPLPLIERMIKEGYTGRKGKGGFYRVNREAGKRKEAMNLATGQYEPERKAKGDFTNSRAVIDACKPWHWRDKFPKVNAPSPEAARLARQRFGYLLR